MGGELFYKKTVDQVDLGGKVVLLRADYNVPIKNGEITDDYRISQSLDTLKLLVEKGARTVVISHLGRPEGKKDLNYSLASVAKRLTKLLKQEVKFVNDCIGESVSHASQELKEGQVLLLENLRFYPGEEANDEVFARQLISSSRADLFVQDGFGVVHRAHASTDAIARQNIMAVAGLLLKKEVENITKAIQQPERPMLAIIGGAKISDKIEILEKFLDIADAVAVVGAMANTFLVAEGHRVGSSIYEKSALTLAKKIIKKARALEKNKPFSFILPVDAVVSEAIDGTKKTRVVDLASHSLADINAYPKKPAETAHSVARGEMILDIGPISSAVIAGAISMSRTVVWNGTAGVTETKASAGAEPPFSHGTRIIVEALIGDSRRHINRPFSLVGGGDTVGYVEQNGLTADFSHVSTGGGASLELMAGRKLPGIEVLWNKD